MNPRTVFRRRLFVVVLVLVVAAGAAYAVRAARATEPNEVRSTSSQHVDSANPNGRNSHLGATDKDDDGDD
jgi:hypothetical protein